MYEICGFLAATTPKAKKSRKPAKARIGIGSKVVVFSCGSHEGVVVSARGNGYWNVQVGDRMTWAHRNVMDVVA